MFVDEVVFRVGMVLLVVGVLVGAVVWTPGYAAAFAGLLLTVLGQHI